MQKETLLVGGILLLVGLGVGYGVGAKQAASVPAPQTAISDVHVMSSGTTMTDTMESMSSALVGKTGDDFDRTFITEMILHHEGAVAMAELALTEAKHQEIKDLAGAVITAQQKEITDMKQWLEDWYGIKK